MKLSAYLSSLILILVATVLPVNAQETTWQTAEPSSLDNPEVQRVADRLKQASIISGTFSQEKWMHGMKVPIRSSGNFIFWRERGLHQAAQKPFFNAFTITESQLINWSADGRGTLIKENAAIVQREINKTLLSFFNADIALIAQRFEIEWAFSSDSRWRLNLTPKLKALAEHMNSIELSGKDLVESLSITAGNGDRTLMHFSEQSEREALTAQECQKFFLEASMQCQSLK